jgi:hypothetical protein
VRPIRRHIERIFYACDQSDATLVGFDKLTDRIYNQVTA